MQNRDEIRNFLASRRARLTPKKAGLPVYGSGRRRVTGLRREEVALLAGVSVDYYTKLERGNLSGVSDSVLDAIANALQLDESERAHLANLARASNPAGRPRRRPSSQLVRAPVQQILNAMPGAPAAHLPVASPQPGRTEGSSVMKALEGRPHEAVTSAPAESQQRTLLRPH